MLNTKRDLKTGIVAQRSLLTRFIILIVIPAFLYALFIAYKLNDSLPQTSNQISLTGITQSIIIARDKLGYVSISSTEDRDVFSAWGTRKHKTDCGN